MGVGMELSHLLEVKLKKKDTEWDKKDEEGLRMALSHWGHVSSDELAVCLS